MCFFLPFIPYTNLLTPFSSSTYTLSFHLEIKSFFSNFSAVVVALKKKESATNKWIYFWLANAQKKRVSTRFFCESNKLSSPFIADSLLSFAGKNTNVCARYKGTMQDLLLLFIEYFSDSLSLLFAAHSLMLISKAICWACFYFSHFLPFSTSHSDSIAATICCSCCLDSLWEIFV